MQMKLVNLGIAWVSGILIFHVFIFFFQKTNQDIWDSGSPFSSIIILSQLQPPTHIIIDNHEQSEYWVDS